MKLLCVGVALLAATALVVNLVHGLDRPGFRVVNYFSYFTNLSNLFAIVVLLGGARREFVRGAATFCTTVTGIIYAVLLADISVGVTDPWINTVLHRVVPLCMLLDWAFLPRAALVPRKALVLSRLRVARA